jgi:hypothetical protein
MPYQFLGFLIIPSLLGAIKVVTVKPQIFIGEVDIHLHFIYQIGKHNIQNYCQKVKWGFAGGQKPEAETTGKKYRIFLGRVAVWSSKPSVDKSLCQEQIL